MMKNEVSKGLHFLNITNNDNINEMLRALMDHQEIRDQLWKKMLDEEQK